MHWLSYMYLTDQADFDLTGPAVFVLVAAGIVLVLGGVSEGISQWKKRNK